jgi:hypothetical protein
MSLNPWLNREMAAESPVGPAPTIKMDMCSGSGIVISTESTDQCFMILTIYTNNYYEVQVFAAAPLFLFGLSLPRRRMNGFFFQVGKFLLIK